MLEKEEIVSPNLEELKSHYRSIITLLGEDAEREGLLKTPERVAKAMLSLTKGYHMDPHEVLRSAKFQEEYSQMVIVKDIDFFSLCEHHMLPFYGKAHVAYIPNGYITGLSKIARVVDIFLIGAERCLHRCPPLFIGTEACLPRYRNQITSPTRFSLQSPVLNQIHKLFTSFCLIESPGKIRSSSNRVLFFYTTHLHTHEFCSR